jgi:nucleoside 2-deoxyribosyltransferase
MAFYRKKNDEDLLFRPSKHALRKAFVQECAERMRQGGNEVFVGSDKYLAYQPAFETRTSGDSEPISSDELNNGKLSKSKYAREVFSDNFARLVEADLLIVLLDGSQVDDRIACEIGIFYSLSQSAKSKKSILGFATDVRCLRRRDSTFGINIFTLGTLEEIGKVVEGFDQVLVELRKLSE